MGVCAFRLQETEGVRIGQVLWNHFCSPFTDTESEAVPMGSPFFSFSRNEWRVFFTLGKGNFWGWEWRVLEGRGRAGSGFAEAGELQEGNTRYQSICELEGSEGWQGWSQTAEGKIQAVGENSGRTQERKSACFNCLSFYCQMSSSSSWKRIRGEDSLCFPVNSIPATVPHYPYACSLPTAGTGQSSCWEDRQHLCASCHLPGPHLLSEGREGRSIYPRAFVEPRMVRASCWGQREAVPGSLEWYMKTDDVLLMQSSAPWALLDCK